MQVSCKFASQFNSIPLECPFSLLQNNYLHPHDHKCRLNEVEYFHYCPEHQYLPYSAIREA